MDTEKYYILYDGSCGFCNFWVKQILKRDRGDRFLFASLQSGFGQKFLAERNLPAKNLETIYLWKPQSFYLKKSSAIIKIAEILGGGFSLLKSAYLIPKFLRDGIYDFIAKNRQKLLGSCEIPSENDRKKFVG